MKPKELIRQSLDESKPFSLKARVDEIKTADGLNREEVRAAIAEMDKGGGEVKVTVTKRRREMQDYLRYLYDKLAQEWSFESMAEMMATAHVELVARAITNPEKLGKDGLTAIRDITKVLYPVEKAAISRRLPSGDDREAVLKRLVSRLQEDRALPIDVQVQDTDDKSVDEGPEVASHQNRVELPDHNSPSPLPESQTAEEDHK